MQKGSITKIIMLPIRQEYNYMADRYWVGGSGNCNDTAHWSTSSGGAGGASVPTSSDDIVLDSSSGGSLRISLPVAFSCRNITVESAGAVNRIIGSGPQNANPVNIYGGIQNNNFNYFSITTDVNFKSTSLGNIIDLGPSNQAAIIQCSTATGVSFDGIGGSGILDENTTIFHTDSNIVGSVNLINGTLDLNGKTLYLAACSFNSNYSSARGLINGGAIHLDDYSLGVQTYFNITDSTNLTYDGDLSINISNTSAASVTDFLGGELDYYSLTMVAYPGAQVNLYNSHSFHNLVVYGSIVNFEAGTTQTTDIFISVGSVFGSVNYLRSLTEGEEYFISATSVQEIDYTNVQDCHALGDIPFDGRDNCINSGNNTNWMFEHPEGFFYESNDVTYKPLI